MQHVNKLKCAIKTCQYDHCPIPEIVCVEGTEHKFGFHHLHLFDCNCDGCVYDPSFRKKASIPEMINAPKRWSWGAFCKELDPQKVLVVHASCRHYLVRDRAQQVEKTQQRRVAEKEEMYARIAKMHKASLEQLSGGSPPSSTLAPAACDDFDESTRQAMWSAMLDSQKDQPCDPLPLDIQTLSGNTRAISASLSGNKRRRFSDDPDE
jgi:hypothetical protein